MGGSLQDLLAQSNLAWEKQDWDKYEMLAKRLLSSGLNNKLANDNLLSVAKRYLGAWLKHGEEIFSAIPNTVSLQLKMSELETWSASNNTDWLLNDDSKRAIHEIILLAPDKSHQAQVQISSALRKVARPDLAVKVADNVLTSSRLNYYALASKGAALTDLGKYDHAIELLYTALRPFHPQNGLERPMNALSRALRERGIRSGDLYDLEVSAEVAANSWEICPNSVSLNTYRAAVQALGDSELLEQLNRITLDEHRQHATLNPLAVERAREVIQRGAKRFNEDQFP